ncbi:citrate synthase family protein [Chromobacterium subtsugae]|uniref:citrate synthase family protein n=1 Tax=Chromobacterium subtsugae TaxID=251747 RepID=UPI0007F8C51E|nr:citrate synthase family protein [Chromobacterium subtsugae]OBU88357.1 excisionase [Chromobacterium subtsugae]
MPRYLSSAAAAARLGVSRQTLYAYVSRGLLHADNSGGQRESRYLETEVEQLAAQRTRGRKPKEVAKATLSWGLPVLESAITLIEDGQLYYRGENALELAASQSLEEVAAHLWQCDAAAAFGVDAPPWPDTLPALMAHYRGRRAEETLLPLFTAASDDAPTALWQKSAPRQAEGCGAILRLMTACLLGTRPDAAPIHLQCARAWGVDAEGAELIRMALVLCADHELNASSFTARCIASTGASLRAAVVGGLAALTGGRHGATTARGEALLDEIGDDDSGQKMRERLARGEDLPGFGHHLYPNGDVRAIALLARILPHRPRLKTMVEQGLALTGQPPSVDFALVAVRRHLGLPPGSAFGLFALGRAAGWIAHGLEQRDGENLIRPRAAYIGKPPGIA